MLICALPKDTVTEKQLPVLHRYTRGFEPCHNAQTALAKHMPHRGLPQLAWALLWRGSISALKRVAPCPGLLSLQASESQAGIERCMDAFNPGEPMDKLNSL